MDTKATRQPKRLACYYQNYAWGKKGSTSKVFDLLDESIKENLDRESNYAELWMGTHPNLPSMIWEDSGPEKQTLKEFVLSDADLYLGRATRKNHGDDLPFLLKVLSVDKALSIQAHPDKKLAAELHSKWPNIYKDSNHKPEMAIALTQFEALCGFRPFSEIQKVIRDFPEFRELLERDGNVVSFESTDHKQILQKLFYTLMTSPPELVKKKLGQLFQRLQSNLAAPKADIHELVFRLNKQYPGDVGIFCAFMLNHVILSPGQAIFLGANEPHAYLSGDCVECMATSDNVVRAGLTPKFKDVEVLASMLSYDCSPISEKISNGLPISGNPYSLLYDPPVPEFSVIFVKLPGIGLSQKFDKTNGPGILLVTNASPAATLMSNNVLYSLSKGTVFFIPPNTDFHLNFGDTQSLILLEAFFAYCSN